MFSQALLVVFPVAFLVVFPAALLSIIAGLLRTGEGFAAGIAGAVICLALIPIAPAGVPIIASVLGALVGVGVAGRTARSRS